MTLLFSRRFFLFDKFPSLLNFPHFTNIIKLKKINYTTIEYILSFLRHSLLPSGQDTKTQFCLLHLNSIILLKLLSLNTLLVRQVY